MIGTTAASVRERNVRVLVVDDDLVYRMAISNTLRDIPGVRVVGSAGSITAARAAIEAGGIDAVTIDVVLRDESGLDLLSWIRQNHPELTTVIVTSGSSREARTTVDAILCGASAFVLKPSGKQAPALLKRELELALRAPTKPPRRAALPASPPTHAPGLALATARDVVVVGASTGGPPVVMRLLHALGAFRVPVVITQHMPAGHMKFYTELLASHTGRAVTLSTHGHHLQRGDIVVAAGDHHTTIARRHGELVLEHSDAPAEHGCRPAVDPLFRSTAAAVGAGAIGVVISGMGTDGALGARALRDAGSRVVVQDEATSVVWGMPGATVQAGGADVTAPAEELASWVRRWTLNG